MGTLSGEADARIDMSQKYPSPTALVAAMRLRATEAQVAWLAIREIVLK